MNNIFKNAYFGKAYKTRDGRKAIYITCDDKEFNSHPHQLIQEDTKKFHYHNDYGHVFVKYDPSESEMYDVVSEWHEEINEKELDNLAFKSTVNFPILDTKIGLGGAYNKGFKAGYRKAKGQ